MQSLKDGEDAMLRLDQLEALYYELQLQLYDIQTEVLRCEELLLTAQLQSIRRQMTGECDASKLRFHIVCVCVCVLFLAT